ncbi:MAG: hypothetical protein ACHP84_03725 [Caulobacterales bacterium]
MSATHDDHERQELEALLPWHAAGTLSPREAEKLEAALASDPELARRYDLAREEMAATIHLNETLGAPSARAMDALFAKIDAEPVRRATPSLDLGARISGFFADLSPRTLAWATAALAVVIVAQAAVIGGGALNQKSGGEFTTASGPKAGVQTGAFVLIQFAPDAASSDVTAFLEANHAQIVEGPKPGGIYRVRVAAAGLPKDKLADIVQRLEKDKAVAFVAASQ